MRCFAGKGKIKAFKVLTFITKAMQEFTVQTVQVTDNKEDSEDNRGEDSDEKD